MAKIRLRGAKQATAVTVAAKPEWNMERVWSTEQTAIFEWFANGEGNNLIIRARAGCAKTTSLIEAITHAPERRILLAAFNKIIAEELQARLQHPGAEAKTMHSLGYGFIRQNWSKVTVNNQRKWALMRKVVPPGTPRAVERCVAELHTKARELQPEIVHMAVQDALLALNDIAASFDLLLPLEDEDGNNLLDAGWTDERVAALAHAAMLLALVNDGTIDFADMIFLPIAHRWIRPRYDLVCIDECQDLTPAQITLARGACHKGGRVVVCGDEKQCVYSWRGASATGLDDMKRELNATELGLKTTYRCAQAVVAEAAKLVPDFNASPTAPIGLVRSAIDAKDTLVREATAGDFVLSRTNAPLVPLALALLREGKAAVVRGLDLAKGLRKQVERLERTVDGDIAELCNAFCARVEGEAARIAARVKRGELHESTGDKVLAELNDNLGVVLALAEGCESFADLYARFDKLFGEEARSNAIVLSTVHRAKGLESDRTWLLQSTFRSKRGENAGNWRSGSEEENIRYVAITRAKRELVWLLGDLD